MRQHNTDLLYDMLYLTVLCYYYIAIILCFLGRIMSYCIMLYNIKVCCNVLLYYISSYQGTSEGTQSNQPKTLNPKLQINRATSQSDLCESLACRARTRAEDFGLWED